MNSDSGELATRQMKTLDSGDFQRGGRLTIGHLKTVCGG